MALQLQSRLCFFLGISPIYRLLCYNREMAVTYKDISDNPGYRIGSDGSVWSRRNNRWGLTETWKRLKPGLVKSPMLHYKREFVYLGRGNGHYVHHLVLEAFVGPRPEGYECCHKDGNPMNNNLPNLYWGTPAQNDADQSRHGRKKGEKHHNAVLNDDTVRTIRERSRAGETHTAIAISLGLKRRHVSSIATYALWSHVH